jgi:hypothetical protein
MSPDEVRAFLLKDRRTGKLAVAVRLTPERVIAETHIAD